MILRAALLLSLVAVLAFGVWEMRRWRTPPLRDLISARQRRLRVAGLVFLLLTLALWLGGTFLPVPPHPPRTRGAREAALRFVGYWTVTALCALPLVPLALLDSRENLRRFQRERETLTQERAALVQDYLLRDRPGDNDSPKPAA